MPKRFWLSALGTVQNSSYSVLFIRSKFTSVNCQAVMKEIATSLNCGDAVFDGELVCLGADGWSCGGSDPRK